MGLTSKFGFLEKQTDLYQAVTFRINDWLSQKWYVNSMIWFDIQYEI